MAKAAVRKAKTEAVMGEMAVVVTEVGGWRWRPQGGGGDGGDGVVMEEVLKEAEEMVEAVKEAARVAVEKEAMAMI